MTSSEWQSDPTTGPHGTAAGADGSSRAVGREVATVQVEPGAGYVARDGDLVLWAEQAPSPRGTEALDAAIFGFSDIAARELLPDQAMARISTLLSDARVASLAGLAAVVPTAAGMLSVASGWGTVASGDAEANGADDGPGDHTGMEGDGAPPSEGFEARAAGGATIRVTQLNHELLTVGRQDVALRLAAVGMVSQPATVGLVHGVVPGGAAQVTTRLTIGSSTGETVVTQAPPSGAPPKQDAPSDRSPPEADPNPPPPPPRPPDASTTAEEDLEILSFMSTSGGGYAEGLPVDGPGRPGESSRPNDPNAVIVEGIVCTRGHLNDPLALNCATCGVSMLKHSGSRAEGVRPSLGIIVFDDGATYALGTHLIIGTTPNQADAVQDGRARAVTLDDPSGQIEPVHAEVRLEGWHVVLVDWSTQGTYVLPDGAKTWQAAPRGAPVGLAPGTRLGLGGRTATYDNPIRR